MTHHRLVRYLAVIALSLAASVPAAIAQLPAAAPVPPAPQAQAGRPPAVVSPEALSDGHVVFRIYAPSASTVTLNAGDLPPVTFAAPGAPAVPQTPGSPGGAVFMKAENGV
jgi:hypothetical protein